MREFRSRLSSGRRFVGAKSLNNLLVVRRKPARGFSSWSPRVWVRSRATYKAGATRTQSIDLFDVFDTGAVVRAQRSKYLAIPTENAPFKQGRGGTRRASPSEANVKVRFVPARGGNAVLIDPRSKQVLWVLVRQVRVPKRISIDAVVARHGGRLIDVIETKLDNELARLARRSAP